MEIRKEQDETQFLHSVMSTSHSAPRSENSELLFHVDAKIDYLKDRIESRNERSHEDLISDLNQLKAKIRRQSRRSNIFAILTIVTGFAAAYFALYEKTTSNLEKLVEQRVEREFSTEKIQSTIAIEAEKFTKERAQLLIQSKIDLAIHDIETFKESISAGFKAIEQEQASVTKLIDSNRASLEKMTEKPGESEAKVQTEK